MFLNLKSKFTYTKKNENFIISSSPILLSNHKELNVLNVVDTIDTIDVLNDNKVDKVDNLNNGKIMTNAIKIILILN
jgi:hypothetical protein